MRFRHIYMGLGSLLVILLWLLTDPDSGIIQSLPIGGSTIATLVILLKGILYVALLHLSRKALFDYLDMGKLFEVATRSPEGAGKGIIGIAIAMVAIAIVMLAATL